MLVYGDHRREIDTRAALAEAGGEPVTAFIHLAELAQGLIDAEFDAQGCDHLTPLHAAAMHDLRVASRRIAAQWDGRPDPTPANLALAALPLPERVTVKAAEGYAFYGLYPESFLEAARRIAWRTPPLVIGLRSIGLSLAAMVAEASGAREAISVRPVGPPFRRELRTSEGLRALLRAHGGPFAVVDEGPGLSGSSFGAALDLLEAVGVDRGSIIVFPSHGHGLGAHASPTQRARWAALRRAVATFDDLAARRPLSRLFEDVTGPVERVEDLSGGAWRGGRAVPAFPQQERTKFRLRTASGEWLVKSAGLGAAGEAAFQRARMLHAAAFIPEPVALRWGFLLSRWEAGVPAEPSLDELARYLRFRAEALPGEAGASLEGLAEMVRVNAGELGLDITPQPPAARPRPVQVDGRLHRWEWLRTRDGRLLKTDAVDHACAHDLVGHQDIAWDVAGAAVELELTKAQTRRLGGDVGAHPDLVDFCQLAYPAFQAGLWTFAGATQEVDRYQRALEAAWRATPSTGMPDL